MTKILISQLNKEKPDFSSPSVLSSKDKIIMQWFIDWVREGIKNGNLQEGDMLPSKADFAQFFGVSIGTVQSAVRYAEDLGHFESKQCVGTMIRNFNSNKPRIEKMSSKKDMAALEIKKIIAKSKLNSILPSARILGSKIGISHNTIRLALDSLTREGFLVQRILRGNEIRWAIIKNAKVENQQNAEEIKSKTLSVKISEKIKDYIIKNYKIGDKIASREEFAIMTKTSIRTVNDAMKILSKEEIILSRRGQYGTIYISNPNKKTHIKTEKSIFMTNPIKETFEKELYNWEKALKELKKYIIKNFESGDKIPSMQKIGELLGVSSNTIRKAVGVLCKQQVLYTQRGKYGGTYVNSMPEGEEEAYTWLALNPNFLKKD